MVEQNPSCVKNLLLFLRNETDKLPSLGGFWFSVRPFHIIISLTKTWNPRKCVPNQKHTTNRVPTFISLIFPWFFLSFQQDILGKKTFILVKCGPTYHWGRCLQKHQFITITDIPPKKRFFLRLKCVENGFEKSSLIWNFFPWYWLKNPQFFPDFPDWKKFSKFSLIGGNPEQSGSLRTHAAAVRRCFCSCTRRWVLTCRAVDRCTGSQTPPRCRCMSTMITGSFLSLTCEW